MKIAIILGHYSIGNRPLNFNLLWQSDRGLTGTELAFVMIGKELHKLGHDVSLFTIYADIATLS